MSTYNGRTILAPQPAIPVGTIGYAMPGVSAVLPPCAGGDLADSLLALYDAIV